MEINSEEFIETVRQAFTTARQTSDWDFYVQTLLKYDGYNLFTNSLLKRLAPRSVGLAVDSTSSQEFSSHCGSCLDQCNGLVAQTQKRLGLPFRRTITAAGT